MGAGGGEYEVGAPSSSKSGEFFPIGRCSHDHRLRDLRQHMCILLESHGLQESELCFTGSNQGVDKGCFLLGAPGENLFLGSSSV